MTQLDDRTPKAGQITILHHTRKFVHTHNGECIKDIEANLTGIANYTCPRKNIKCIEGEV